MSDPRTIDPVIPALEAGQVLDRAEFERRYQAMPHLKRAELIEGVVHMAPLVSLVHHGEPHLYLATWLGVYRGATPGVRAGDNSTVQLSEHNEPQPDLLLMINPDQGGQATLEGGYITGAPELAVEVSYSRVAVDLGPRFRAYLANGVREYLIWRTDTNAVLWFVQRADTYERLEQDASGIVRSETFPGLWLNVPALLRMDMPAVLASLQLGLASPEHAAFLARLRGTP